VPVLSDALEKVKEVIQRVLPLEKRLSALEEAEFEDVGGEELGALDREMLSQGMDFPRYFHSLPYSLFL
jgi:ATPase family AAA domain-containing protein 2